MHFHCALLSLIVRFMCLSINILNHMLSQYSDMDFSSSLSFYPICRKYVAAARIYKKKHISYAFNRGCLFVCVCFFFWLFCFQAILHLAHFTHAWKRQNILIFVIISMNYLNFGKQFDGPKLLFLLSIRFY